MEAKIIIVGKGEYEDYEDVVYLGEEKMGSTRNMVELLENLLIRLGLDTDITTTRYIPDTQQYITTDEEFKTELTPGTWITFEDGSLALVINENWIKLQTEVGREPLSPEQMEKMSWAELMQSFPERN